MIRGLLVLFLVVIMVCDMAREYSYLYLEMKFLDVDNLF